MDILLLTQVLPYPPDGGPKIKTYNLIRFLAPRHRLTLVSFTRGDQDQAVDHLRRYCHRVRTVPMRRSPARDLLALGESLLSGKPWVIVRDRREAMHRLVAQLVCETDFDLVHADQLNMAQYAERVPGAARLLDAHNALWLLYRRLWKSLGPGPKRWLLRRDWRLVKRYEGLACRRFDGVIAVSQEDRAALREALLSVDGVPNGSAITVIPIAIDVQGIKFVERAPGADRILHLGTMFWPPNVEGMLWFLREVMPRVWEGRPDARLEIVGARPPRVLRAWGGRDARVRVHGYVEDPQPLLEGAAMMVVPLLAGGGMRVKILNALAQGIPVVSTSIGAEGIRVSPGEHLLIADEPPDFARAVLELLADARMGKRLAQKGRALAESHYDFRKAYLPYEEIYGALAGGGGRLDRSGASRAERRDDR